MLRILRSTTIKRNKLDVRESALSVAVSGFDPQSCKGKFVNKEGTSKVTCLAFGIKKLEWNELSRMTDTRCKTPFRNRCNTNYYKV